MANSTNPEHAKRTVASTQYGEVRILPSVFDFSQDYAPAVLDAEDTFQIGIVPAGHRLIPHLCVLRMPALETGGPTGDYTIGTETDPDALRGSAAAETAVTISGEDWTLTNIVGSATEATPILVTIVAGADVTTPTTTGVCYFDMAVRPWDPNYDE